MERVGPRKGLQRKEYGVMHERQRHEVGDELSFAQTRRRGDAPFADVVAAADHAGEGRAQEGDQQRGDRVDPRRAHGEVHRDAQRQSGAQNCRGRRVERQQGDEDDVYERVEVDADGQVVEQENLKQHRRREKSEIW